MQLISQIVRSRKAQAGLAAMLVAWFLYASLLAANPTLHRSIHNDGDRESHQCAVTLIEQQLLLAGECVPTFIVRDLNVSEQTPIPVLANFSSADYRFSSSRAPPVS